MDALEWLCPLLFSRQTLQRCFGLGISLIGSFAKPISSLGIILGYASAVGIHHAKVELSLGLSLIGGFAKPISSLSIIFGYTFAFRIHPAKVELSLGISRIRSFLQLLERC